LVHPVEKRHEWQRFRPEVVGSGNPKSAKGSEMGCALSRPPKIEPFIRGIIEKETTLIEISIRKSRIRFQWCRVQWSGPRGAHFHGRIKDNLICLDI